ncbi:hypothetical protein N7454_003283 [Penicillium verhagenii]|nr:hypothetical protein N7454_003283 [Penicillium verhagenii]
MSLGDRRVKFALFGLGRLGVLQARILAFQQPRIELVAVSFFVAFSEQSGGIFLDFGIHTVSTGLILSHKDQSSNTALGRRWTMPAGCQVGPPQPQKQVNRVIAFGQQAVYGDLAKFGDADNAWGLVEYANGKIFKTYLGRTLTSGFEDMTRLCGTKGHSIISANSNVEIRDNLGIRTQSVPDAFTLFDATFLTDLAEFAEAVLDDKPMTCQPKDAFEAGKICAALQ